MSKKIDLEGQRFGRLIAVTSTKKNKHGQTMWLCRCDCGNLAQIRIDHLRKNLIKSCGCLKKELTIKRNFKHGDTLREKKKAARLYRIWAGIKTRCLNPSVPIFKYYGGRGIKVCAEWKNNYAAFKKWALANGYSGDLTIDRINNNGNYKPSNCQWITRAENARKMRIENT